MPTIALGDHDISGDWNISQASKPGGGTYLGVVSFDREGEAWRCRWDLTEPSGKRSFDGVGFQVGSDFFASRSLLPREGEEAPSSGIVVYDAHVFGRLPAQWYHPDLQGCLGEGLPVDGPVDRLPGTYRAEYRSTSEEFEPLTKQLAEAEGHYNVHWLNSNGLMYVGVGFEAGDRLVVGWATPRRDIDALKFTISANDQRLTGAWETLARAGVGSECLVRP